MIIEVKGLSHRSELRAYLSAEPDKWKELADTIENQDFPLKGSQSFFDMINDIKSLHKPMREQVIKISKWRRRPEHIVVLNFSFDIRSIALCKKCKTLVLSVTTIDEENCKMCNSVLTRFESGDKKR
jgi:hypothetical protein